MVMNEQSEPGAAGAPGPSRPAGPGLEAPAGSAGKPPAGAAFFAWLRSLGLTRSGNRWIGGVAEGIAARTGLDPALVRGLFIVFGLFGVGLLAYGVAWALLPEPDGRIHLEEALAGNWSSGMTGALVFTVLGLGGPGISFWAQDGWFAGTYWGIFWVTGVIVFVYWLSTRDRSASRPNPPGTDPRRQDRTEPFPGAGHAAGAQATAAGPVSDSGAGPAADPGVGSGADPGTGDGGAGGRMPATDSSAWNAPGGGEDSSAMGPVTGPDTGPVSAPASAASSGYDYLGFRYEGSDPGDGASRDTASRDTAFRDTAFGNSAFGNSAHGSRETRGYGSAAPSVPAEHTGPPGAWTMLLLGLALLAAGAILALDYTGVMAVEAPAAVALAAAAAVLGLGIVVLGCVGRSSGPAGAVAVLALAASLVVGGALVHRNVVFANQSHWNPEAARSAGEGYTVAAAQGNLDLTGLADELRGGGLTVPVSVAAGDLTILVPDDVAVSVQAEMVLGNVNLEGPQVSRTSSGIWTGGDELRLNPSGTSDDRLVIEVRGIVSSVLVTTNESEIDR